jgi:hypothetical protein
MDGYAIKRTKMISDFEMFLHLNGVYTMLKTGMKKRSVKMIPPLIMAAVDKKDPEVQKLILNTECQSRCFRILEPDILNEKNQNEIFFKFGKQLKEENENVLAILFAGMFWVNQPDPDTGEVSVENRHECFVVTVLTKDKRAVARIVPLDRCPDGSLILLNTKNQFTDRCDYEFLKEFFHGYNSGYWSFSKMFGGN